MLKRTHTCGVLRKSEVGKEAILTGWVASRRDHGGLVFIGPEELEKKQLKLKDMEMGQENLVKKEEVLKIKI